MRHRPREGVARVALRGTPIEPRNFYRSFECYFTPGACVRKVGLDVEDPSRSFLAERVLGTHER
ncbi:hypothetical protein AB0F88_36930 [Streptosporangium sp. NPDC023963]|uniref:hypothetical protein n=1 Tax=Streptosporangium sp. NPDC023963 TaxID=3155608 RepID=UPI003440583A